MEYNLYLDEYGLVSILQNNALKNSHNGRYRGLCYVPWWPLMAPGPIALNKTGEKLL